MPRPDAPACPCGCSTPEGRACFVLSVVLPAALVAAGLEGFAPRAAALVAPYGGPADRLAGVDRAALVALSHAVHRAAGADPATTDAYYGCLSFCLSTGFDVLDQNPLVSTTMVATTATMALRRAVPLLTGTPEGLAAALVLRDVPPCTALSATAAATASGA